MWPSKSHTSFYRLDKREKSLKLLPVFIDRDPEFQIFGRVFFRQKCFEDLSAILIVEEKREIPYFRRFFHRSRKLGRWARVNQLVTVWVRSGKVAHEVYAAGPATAFRSNADLFQKEGLFPWKENQCLENNRVKDSLQTFRFIIKILKLVKFLQNLISDLS